MKQLAIRRIAVLVSIGRHPVSGVPRYSRNDAAALGLAHDLARHALDISIDVIHAGQADNPALPEYLALGATRVSVIEPAADQDVLPALQEQLQGYDLVLCGSRAESGEASGMLPYRLAARLNLPLLAGVIAVTSGSDAIVAEQFLPKGRRREVVLSLPALLTVHSLAPSRLRYAYARLRAGRISSQAFPAGTGTAGSEWRIENVKALPRKLAAPEKRSGHARMQAATVAESRGGKVLQEGSAADKAQAVLAYLREHHLVDY
ncbi:drug:proton antiporter [Collimonas pratensis]|uniref:Electron transfer flavodomain protein n=1 Tax=Collimonas pratensis TaxID=279113 RepID=A0A127Q2E1_9BURK|nr:drug:proton antiporter [Collimonas pratensis]AMP03792.1 electron transfer flavodomain protein [Collimonas pratensis]